MILMVFYDVRSISLKLLESMRLLVCHEDGILRIRPDDEVSEEGVVEPESERRGAVDLLYREPNKDHNRRAILATLLSAWVSFLIMWMTGLITLSLGKTRLKGH